jgi:hypothetical protein
MYSTHVVKNDSTTQNITVLHIKLTCHGISNRCLGIISLIEGLVSYPHYSYEILNSSNELGQILRCLGF